MNETIWLGTPEPEIEERKRFIYDGVEYETRQEALIAAKTQQLGAEIELYLNEKYGESGPDIGRGRARARAAITAFLAWSVRRRLERDPEADDASAIPE